MAINRVDYPANLTDQADFSAHGELIETRFLDQSYAPQFVVAGEIPQGVVLQIGGVVYRADSDTAITGAASDYVRIVPDGATATAEYVANLSGVTWNTQYNGYYDTSGNLYVFDEGVAVYNGELSLTEGRSAGRTRSGHIYAKNMYVGSIFPNRIYPNNSDEFQPLIDPGSTYTLAAPYGGVFMGMTLSETVRMEIYQDGEWREVPGFWHGGAIITDGSTVRFRNTGSVAAARIRFVRF